MSRLSLREIYLNASYRLDPMGTEGVEPLGNRYRTIADANTGVEVILRGKVEKKPYKIKLEKRPQ